jgi:GNAT superfamily N-acetyltransferase
MLGAKLVLRKLWRNFKDYGVGIALRKAMCRILACIYESRVYCVYRIDLESWQPREPVPSRLRYVFIGPEEHDLIAQIEEIEEWLDGHMIRRLRAGSLCVVALDGPRVVGFNLVSFGRVSIPLIGSEWVLGPTHAWSEQISVIPGYRVLGLASELRYRIFTELRRCGITRLYGGTLAINIASRKLARKVGFKSIFEVHYRKVMRHITRRYVKLKTEQHARQADYVHSK